MQPPCSCAIRSPRSCCSRNFPSLRTRAILVIASAYLFTALILIPFVLVFPGVFAPGRGLLGGLQSTSWVWCFWHAGFPLFVIGYALSKDADSRKRTSGGTARARIALSVALTAAVVVAATFFVVAGEALLPRVASDTLQFSALWPYFIGAPVALANIAALIVLWVRRQSMLDLWLLVVLCLYLIEVPLSYYPDPERFSVGWYTVRVFGGPVEQLRADRAAVRDRNALCEAARCGPGPAPRTRSAPHDRRRCRGLDSARGEGSRSPR